MGEVRIYVTQVRNSNECNILIINSSDPNISKRFSGFLFLEIFFRIFVMFFDMLVKKNAVVMEW